MKRTPKRSLYFNGDVLTLGDPLYAEAVLVTDGVITRVGRRDDLLQEIDRSTNIVNLNGGVLLPGFIDTHSRLFQCALNMAQVKLQDCHSFTDITHALRRQSASLPTGDWIVGVDYDPQRLVEQTHPDCRLLEAALPGRKCVIIHTSGRIGVFSPAAMSALQIDANTPDPPSGEISRFPDGQPDGFLSDAPFLQYQKQIPPPSEESILHQLERAQQEFARYGITTLQEGRLSRDSWKALRQFSDSGRLKLDVVCYADAKQSRHILQENLSRLHRYKRHLKLAGCAICLDGSPEKRTAWVSFPYENSQDKEFYGVPLYTDEEAELLLFESMNDHLQVIVHCCGDAAAHQMLSILQRITENRDMDLRPVMLHAQLLRPDQLPAAAHLGVIPSFSSAHLYYWGNTLARSFGSQRTEEICPCQSAKQAGVTFTLHRDPPEHSPDILHTLWCAVNRQARSGKLLGEQEQISTLDALRAVTSSAAFQFFEENNKGVIAPGMTADFVILQHNPLRVQPQDIRNIRVLKTIKEDESIYEYQP